MTSTAHTPNAGRDASGVRGARDPRALSPAAAVTGALLIALVVAVADQAAKRWAAATLEAGVARPLIGDLLQLRLIHNSGAAWGLGSGITPVVTIVQLAICLGAIVVVVRSVRSGIWTLALGLVVGGALGNIHDRLLLPPGPFRGEVVDFLELPHWPIFNVADMAVVAGALLIAVLGVVGVPTVPGRAEDGGPEAAERDVERTQARRGGES